MIEVLTDQGKQAKESKQDTMQSWKKLKLETIFFFLCNKNNKAEKSFFTIFFSFVEPARHYGRGSSHCISWHQNQLILTTFHVCYHIALWDNCRHRTALIFASERFLECLLVSGLCQLAMARTPPPQTKEGVFAWRAPSMTL